MKKIITCTFLLQSLLLFSQSKEGIEADYELQGYFKNYQEFNLDSLKKKKFKHIRLINSIRGGFEFDRILDNNLKQAIYTITIEHPLGRYSRYKEYKVHVFSKRDSIICLISYEESTGNVNSYFDYEKLSAHIELHNKLYETNFRISDFVDQLKERRIYGFQCGYSSIANAPLVYNDIYFDDIRNGKYFRKWLTSFNPELQAYGVKGLEGLEEKEKLPLSPLEKKLIKHIKERNSTLLICGGCVSFPRKLYDETKK
ncbi:hypothetical protein U8527_18815 [Kordia algicida OT-1]|uniref:Uncharacterized protein n=1 Tax=Kordia algicida OT-1 TaxID=391587 RepID=A9DJ92_9FLAO|nr:hypothetical protein [Kordia algicida]EDP98053.1 hypothetical protein KAOT1_12587 [Kordia algicida OT-1]